MRGLILRLLINVLALWIASSLLSGIVADTGADLIWAAIALGLINALVRPLIVLLTLPFTLVTLGLFLLVINAAMLSLAAWFVDGFTVLSVLDAVLGALVVTVIGWAGSSFVGENGRIERLDTVVMNRRRS